VQKNHGISYGDRKVELLEIEYPKLALGDRKCEHGVILKIIALIFVVQTNIWLEEEPPPRRG
jgi:hypothetical protein